MRFDGGELRAPRCPTPTNHHHFEAEDEQGSDVHLHAGCVIITAPPGPSLEKSRAQVYTL